MTLSNYMTEAKKELSESPTADNYKSFIGLLSLSLVFADEVSKSAGRYYNKNQDELGPIARTVYQFLNTPYAKLALIAVVAAGMMAAYSFFSFPVSPLLLLFSENQMYTFVTFVAQVVTQFVSLGVDRLRRLWELQQVRHSSSKLREMVRKKLNVEYSEDTVSIGQKETAVVNALARKNLSPNTPLLQYWDFIQKTFSEYLEVSDDPYDASSLASRIKLLVLTVKLRDKLKKLPIVLLEGLTESGKTTLKEMLRNPQNPDRSRFGGRQRNRTTVPDLVVCSNNSKPFCVLDTIGVGDRSLDEKQVEALKKLNEIFLTFSSATILVCSQNEDSHPIVKEQIQRTSLHSSKDILRQPILTCFNKADTVFGYGEFGAYEDYDAKLRAESEDRINSKRFYDLRTINDDYFAPRVYSVFHPDVPVPPEPTGSRYGKVFITPKEVRGWLENIFYNAHSH